MHYMDEYCETRPWPVLEFVRNPMYYGGVPQLQSWSFTTTDTLPFPPHCCLSTCKASILAQWKAHSGQEIVFLVSQASI